ncbi:MAG TPA: hypothetical protein VNH44_11785, partial [Micropepsaceae bacterium]|nr:hypothetical protein [Micropepsaceae bacterium]
NAARDRLLRAAETDARIDAALTLSHARQLLYDLYTECFRDSVLLRWAASKSDAADPRWRALLALAATWQRPVFPLDGNDVMALGVDEGPEIGVLLKDIERWWVEQDFTAGRPFLLERLKQAVNKPRA